MRRTTIIGGIFGTTLIAIMVVLNPEAFEGLVNPTAVLITLGGTLAAGVVSFSWGALTSSFESLALILWRGCQPSARLADQLVALARQAKSGSVADLDLSAVRHPYMRLGLQLVADGTEAERVVEVMELEGKALRRVRLQTERLFRTLGTYSPMFGLIGTIVGLIRMLRNLSEPAQIGSGMAVALVTTLYGVLAAALVFLPFASKIRELAQREAVQRELILCGVTAIQAKDNPQLLREKLDTFTRRGEQGRRGKA
ncbi:MAG: MotA/TolQ/ExbB proton channel family protein [Deltaproteobacteria bacterium]|nr:MotA/TolQ/ExbB proton channel family protein [Deltaproteobacteria bacterium]